MRKIMLSLSLILVLAMGSIAVFAADAAPAAAPSTVAKSNVEILDELLKDKDSDEIIADLKAGKSLSQQAQDGGVFDAFVDAIKDAKIARIDALIASGALTKERGELMKDFIENHDCTGTQQFAMRNALNNGERFGLGQGKVNGGQGLGKGYGPGNGGGRGGMMRGGMIGQGFGQGFGPGACAIGTTAVPAQ